ncbi:hypothetical protein N2152v2_005467 [Parachlorella kessleri]
MADNFLIVSPTELKFRFELRKNIPVTLTLQNPTDERVAFKVKTTSPKKYCVRPSSGIVEPSSSKEVQVIMQAQRDYPASFADCKDKFLIQCVKTSSDAADVTPEMFDSTKVKDIRQSKLRVVLVGPPKPPSPVPEGNEEPASPATKTYKEPRSTLEAPTADGAVSVLNAQLGAAQQDKAEIKKRLDKLEGYSQGGRPNVKQVQPIVGSYTLVHLVVIALLAFLLGYFGGKLH